MGDQQQDEPHGQPKDLERPDEADPALPSHSDQRQSGHEIPLCRCEDIGKPVAKLVPLEKPGHDRKPGSAKGKIIIADDFDAPLPDDILKEFYK